ncbi:MAG: glycosyltransferase [Bacteroidota bacterium]|nr:glycosyltransferase [Bacteroidota bacterium]
MYFGKGDDIKQRKLQNKKTVEKKRIVIAPLDWGLGHATRCIPIIRELLVRRIDVVIAADGRTYDLLKKEFPSVTLYRLPGFSPTYNEKGASAFHMIRQLPMLIKATIGEHRAIQRLIETEKIDSVISDNRFGLFTTKVPTVYIVHQIRILMPHRLRIFEWAVYYIHQYIIKKYTECWIPDYSGSRNLSDKLAHSFPLPSNATFIGPLTRLRAEPSHSSVTSRLAGKKSKKMKRNVLVILSGPEPQRTIFEQLVTRQLMQSDFSALIVQGIPETNEKRKLSPKITIVSMLSAEELRREILAVEIVLSRSGYSTIMDLAALGKKAIFVPTPGQTEQEYLAAHFHETKVCFSMNQHDFDLQRAVEASKEFRGFIATEMTEPQLPKTIAEFLTRLQAA